MSFNNLEGAVPDNPYLFGALPNSNRRLVRHMLQYVLGYDLRNSAGKCCVLDSAHLSNFTCATDFNWDTTLDNNESVLLNLLRVLHYRTVDHEFMPQLSFISVTRSVTRELALYLSIWLIVRLL